MFDLALLAEERRRWIRMGLGDGEIEIKRVGPKEQERFRQKLIADGILRKGEGAEIASGRLEAFCQQYAKAFITGWRNVMIDGVPDPPYDPVRMGTVLFQSTTILGHVADALKEEADFFSQSETES